MRNLLMTAAVLAAAIVPAHAVKHYTIDDMTCARVQSAVKRNGSAVLHYKGLLGLKRHDLFVRDSAWCKPDEQAYPSSAPTMDNPRCILNRCRPKDSRIRRDYSGPDNNPGQNQPGIR